MFVVIYDPPAADDLVQFVARHGHRAWKRTPFVVQIDPAGREADIERLFNEWHEARGQIAAELVTPSRLENLTRA